MILDRITFPSTSWSPSIYAAVSIEPPHLKHPTESYYPCGHSGIWTCTISRGNVEPLLKQEFCRESSPGSSAEAFKGSDDSLVPFEIRQRSMVMDHANHPWIRRVHLEQRRLIRRRFQRQQKLTSLLARTKIVKLVRKLLSSFVLVNR